MLKQTYLEACESLNHFKELNWGEHWRNLHVNGADSRSLCWPWGVGGLCSPRGKPAVGTCSSEPAVYFSCGVALTLKAPCSMGFANEVGKAPLLPGNRCFSLQSEKGHSWLVPSAPGQLADS